MKRSADVGLSLCLFLCYLQLISNFLYIIKADLAFIKADFQIINFLILHNNSLKIGRMKLYFVLLMKSHFQSYPCPLQINSFWNLGFLLGITIILQIITGIFLGLHYTSDLNSAYSSLFFFIQ